METLTGQRHLITGNDLPYKEEESDLMVTPVRLGQRVASVKLNKKRREALIRFVEAMKEAEGKDLAIEVNPGSSGSFRLVGLKLQRMQMQNYPPSYFEREIPWSVNLWGRGNQSIWIDTQLVTGLRVQEYMGFTIYFLDFWNGFDGYPRSPYKPHYQCLHISVIKE